MTLYDVPASAPTALQVLWLGLVAVLWLGFFFLEGFDFGVAMLVPTLGRNEKERRLMVNTIGPLWDGNEVWLLTAGGAMFAAFPGWYATLFSALYLPLLLVLVGLIVRGVAFEYRGKRPEQAWRTRWDYGAAIGSFIAALVFGIGFSNFVIGLPVDDKYLYAGSFLGLFTLFPLLGGLLFVALFLTHGAVFISLKTRGDIRDRARRFAVRSGLVTAVLMLTFVVWQNLQPTLPGQLGGLRTLAWVVGILAVVLVGLAVVMSRGGREGWAFIATGLATVLLILGIFAHLYPGLGFNNSLALAHPLDLTTASSSPKTLTIMTWAAGFLVPVIVAYQAWSYWVFRKRLSVENIPDDAIVGSADEKVSAAD